MAARHNLIPFTTATLLLLAACLAPSALASNVPGGNGDKAKVTLTHHGENYDFDNSNVTVTVNGPTATVTEFKYHGANFINQVGRHDAIYWSMDGGASYQNPHGAVCTVKTATPDMADVGCKEKYDGSQPHAFDIDIHYVLRRGNTGLYVYAILSHPASYPATSVGEWRVAWQTPQIGDKWLLEKIYVDQNRHWVMPTPAEMANRIPHADQGNLFPKTATPTWSSPSPAPATTAKSRSTRIRCCVRARTTNTPSRISASSWLNSTSAATPSSSSKPATRPTTPTSCMTTSRSKCQARYQPRTKTAKHQP